jgi:hypothetical protein
LPADFNPDVVTKQVQEVNQSIFGWPPSETVFLLGVLTPIQLRLLPAGFARSFLTPRKP